MTAPARSPLGLAGWQHGQPSRRSAGGEAAIQVQPVDDRTWVLRQSKTTHYEAPFLYLLAGRRRSLLLDTGATADAARFPLRATVERLIGDQPLLILHSHGHGDHVAADGQFADRPGTTIVPGTAAAVTGFHGWGSPAAAAGDGTPVHLGGRELRAVPTPGHHPASVSLADPTTGILLTGDTVYPGRLYVPDLAAFQASLTRLVRLAERWGLRYLLGGHIEMSTTPGRDYPLGCTYQPNEPPLEMTVRQLENLQHAARSIRRPGVYRRDDVVIYAGTGRSVTWRLVGRGALHRLAEATVGHRH
jgi:hydroxyacylglutathione hydrolase